MKKVLLLVAILLLFTSCTNKIETNIDTEEPIKDPIKDPIKIENKDMEQPTRYTGEIITDCYFGDKGRIYFVPDKETRELLKNEYPYPINPGESIPLDYDDIDIVKDLPNELGIYKVEVEADYKTGNITSKLKSIKLTEEIGTVEYEGKEYPTNELDETVTAKDRVCGLIVSNVRKFDDGGVIIEFEGEIESEGFYNVYPGGEFFNNKRIGRIVPDGESVKNFPSYKGTSVNNNFSVYFSETNELYQKLVEHSAIGRGKFKSVGYDIVYNYGGGVPPKEILTEIISLDENYKDIFPYDDNSITRTLVNEKNKYSGGFMDKYSIVYTTTDINDYRNEPTKRDYYFLGYDEISKIKIISSDEFYYGLKENKSGDSDEFELITSAKNPHSINFKYFDKNSSSSGYDTLSKTYNYGYFKDGYEIVRIFEGDSILGMTSKDINVEYICDQDSPDELVKVMCKFTGKTTLTGKLTLYFDEGYGYNKVFFKADAEGIKKLPIHDDNMIQQQGWITFDYESVKELLGTEPFEKNCEITIDNYKIYKTSYTSSVDTADLITFNFFE